MKRWLALLALAAAERVRVQPHSDARRAGQRRAESDRSSAAASRRPDSESRQHGEGLRAARRGGLHEGRARRAPGSCSAIQTHDAEQMANANAQADRRSLDG